MKWLPWAKKKKKTEDPTAAEIAKRADAIMEELDTVVKQMALLLREKGSADD
jgi:hypothetical protein